MGEGGGAGAAGVGGVGVGDCTFTHGGGEEREVGEVEEGEEGGGGSGVGGAFADDEEGRFGGAEEVGELLDLGRVGASPWGRRYRGDRGEWRGG